MKYLFAFLALSLSTLIRAQGIDMGKVIAEGRYPCLGYKLSIPIEDDYRYSHSNIVEGDFHGYLIHNDTVIFVAQCAMIVRPQMRENVIQNDTISVGGRLVFRRIGHESNAGKMWIEDVYLDNSISFRVRNLNPVLKEKYLDMLNSIEMERFRKSDFETLDSGNK